jgi:uncharacterized protein YgiM (DUF1202 family)
MDFGKQFGSVAMFSIKDIIIVLTVPALAIPLWGQQAQTVDEVFQATKKLPDVPYIAQVVGNNIYVRSGPSTAYYPCSKLNEPAQVTVMDHKYNKWAQILPPEGSFSWIAKKYVRLDASNPGIGIVTDPEEPNSRIMVWAGSENFGPLRSIQMQGKLDTGSVVTLIDQEGRDDYYKIVPPPDARLYISTSFIKYVGPVPEKKLQLPPKPKAPAEESSRTPSPVQKNAEPQAEQSAQPVNPTETEPAGTEQETTAPTDQEETSQDTRQPAVETEDQPEQAEPEKESASTESLSLIDEAKDIGKLLDMELTKPAGEQDFAAYKEKLQGLLEKTAPESMAQSFVQYYLERVASLEMIRQTTLDLYQQQENLSKTRKQIRLNLNEELQQIPDEPRYLLTGILKESYVYTGISGPKRYLLVDGRGKIQAYVIPADQIVEIKTPTLLDHRVGIKGKVMPDPFLSTLIIRFTEIDDLARLPAAVQ